MYQCSFAMRNKSELDMFSTIKMLLLSGLFSILFLFVCSASDDILPIRLVNGPTRFEGRVEIFYENTWGTICDDLWSIEEAQVVCGQLGYSGAVREQKYAFYGEGTGPIILDNVQCVGNETNLADCVHNPWFEHNCEHSEDAGAVCEWEENTVRIHQDTFTRTVAGRVAMYDNTHGNASWGTVCDDSQWDILDAEVVCRQVGFAAAAQLISTEHIETNPNAPVLLSNVQCNGTEEALIDCVHSKEYGQSCTGDFQNAGVACFDEIDDYDLRLIDDDIYDQYHDSGFLQILINGTWGSVCSDGWGYTDSQVVCHQLGYEEAEMLTFPNDNKLVGPIHMTNVQCEGHESSLITCTHSNNVTSTGCGHANDTYVRCKGPRVRLFGGQTPYEGRVEVLHHGKWGTISQHDWGMINSDVICRQMGHDKAIDTFIIPEENYEPATGPIMLSNVVCNELDDYLSDCQHDGWFIHHFDHSYDVGVTCDRGPVYRTRLVGSGASLDFEGRVEMFYEGSWGTVCDTNWDMTAANVVCKELGFSRALRALDGAYFGEGNGQILMDNVTCNDYEQHLSHCEHPGWYQTGDCTHANDASVICDPGTDTPIKLNPTNDHTAYEGIVYTYHGEQWTPVCGDYDWDNADATVVCRQMFPSDHMVPKAVNISMDNYTPRLLKGVSCGGWEYELTDCAYDGWGECFSGFEAAVECNRRPSVSPDPGDIRLVDGSRASEGRVEIYYEQCEDGSCNGDWGSICDTNWGIAEAEVVCRQLGYPHTMAATTDSVFRFGSGNILLDHVSCMGVEDKLTHCRHDGWGVHSCDVVNEAGVVCGVNDGTLRLADGKNQYEGRLEIHYEGVWGTICDVLWGMSDAEVACRQLGLGEAIEISVGAKYGEGSGPVLLDYVSCYGHESRIDECARGAWYDTDCDHSRDAGIKCKNPNAGSGNDDLGLFTDVPLILGFLLAFLCVVLWCYKPCCQMIQKRRVNSATNRFLREMSFTPGDDFPDIEMWPEDDLPTYQDAAADLPPAYDCLYANDESSTGGLDNPAVQIDTSSVDNDESVEPDTSPSLEQDDGAITVSDTGHNISCPGYSDIISDDTSTIIETSPEPGLSDVTYFNVTNERETVVDNEPNNLPIDNENSPDASHESHELVSPISDFAETFPEAEGRLTNEAIVPTVNDVMPDISGLVESDGLISDGDLQVPMASPDEHTGDDTPNSSPIEGGPQQLNDTRSFTECEKQISISGHPEDDECFV